MNDRRSVEQKLDRGEERTLLTHISPCLFFSAILSLESGRHEQGSRGLFYMRMRDR